MGFFKAWLTKVRVGSPCDLGYESWSQKTRVARLPNGGNCMILRSLVLTHYQRVTDGRTDTPPAAKSCRIAGQKKPSVFAKVLQEPLKPFLITVYILTATLDQLRVVASSTSNDPGPRFGQHQQIGQCLFHLLQPISSWTTRRALPVSSGRNAGML